MAVLASVAWGQVEVGKVSGVAADPSGASLANAQVSLENPLTGRLTKTNTDEDGEYRFENVPYGAYVLRVSAPGFGETAQPIEIRSNVPLRVSVTMAIAPAGSKLTVEAETGVVTETPRTETTIDERVIRLAGAGVRGNPLQTLISTTPGWSTENDGLMHIRGVDDGILYVIGGIPTPDRVDGTFAASFDTEAITSLNVITGNIPAEYGGRSGAVVLVQPKSGLATPLNGTLSLEAGSFDSRDVSATVAGGTRAWGLFFAGAARQSDRFLDPVDPRNFNNDGGDVAFDLRSDWNVTEKDVLRLSGTAQGASFHVPNNEVQQAAGQRQRQELRHDQESLSWQHIWSPATLSDVSYYRSYFRSELLPSEFDVPLTAQQERHHTRQGVLASLTRFQGGHTLKFGLEAARVSIAEQFGFAVTDKTVAAEEGISDAAMQFTSEHPFEFAGHASRGTQSLYAQDDFALLRNFRVSAGVRYDHSDLLISDQQLSPRIGGSYFLPFTHTVFRASFNRLYMPPQVENLLIASSEQARALSPFAETGGGADIRPETISAWEAGFSQQLPRSIRLNAAYWWRHFRNIDDPNVLLGTTVIFPNSVARARAQGLDVRLDIPMRRGISANVTYTNNRVVEFGPLNGGLFLDDDLIEIGPGTRFTPDHDQRNVVSASALYSGRRRGLWMSFTGRYESGVPLELPDLGSAELRALPGANLVNFSTGRVKPWYVFGVAGGVDLVSRDRFTLSAQLDVQNLADYDFAFNWGNPFSGTHFGFPRLVAGRLKFGFR